ncbi:hypothetical protein P775_24690 [Puniceibacterium antarcticum]|uniref:Uncharacterized protein n=1 Tax=Puniceibacterium antarcticum TaxID=1206336 RepID=A0A2G8R6T1_9RHOB|nr:hypothetical protein [Puniceibacterium antarcticum]PIL17244.1 hypothetical protein P775_24690 [Puniceibacterium antarcticum]
MPDLDTGHFFLTTMAPIKPGASAGDPQSSYVQRVRMALASFPTAHQSPATETAQFNSPFSRNTRNHLARMFVLNDVVFNGRITENPIVAQIKGVQQTVPQPVDRLKAAYLVFCADVDAIVNTGDPLPTNLTAEAQRHVRAAYARELWGTMSDELFAVYSNCYGFETVETADDFANFLDKCHVETTMPFHDYYLELPKFHILPYKPLLYGVLAPFVVGIVLFLLWIFGVSTVPFLGWPIFLTCICGFVLGFVAAFLAIKYAIRNGEKPLPPAKYDDLPSVLKSLYIQQKFSDFFIQNQGVSAEELHNAFGAFIAEHKPQNRHSKTQRPGVISSADPRNVIS